MQKRRAQASGAATVVGLMLLLFIFYIIFIPAETRQELMGEKETATAAPGTGATQHENEEINFLLQAAPGKIAFAEEDKIEHSIPNLWLAESKDAQVIDSYNPMAVRRGWFVNEVARLPFTMGNLADTFNAALIFSAPVREGLLAIKLNDKVVFEGELTNANAAPVMLKKDWLQRDNIIELSVAGVGLRFWDVNEYQLTGIQVIADITDWQRQQATNIFTVAQDEFNSIKTSRLEFSPVCDQETTGVLGIYFNEKNVYSAVPDCDSMNKFDLFPADFAVGKNAVLFKITQGSYLLDRIKIVNTLKEPKAFVSYFYANAENYTDISSGVFRAWLNITFVDDDLAKQAVANVNGRYSYIDQETPTYLKDISDYIVEGNNYISLTPETELNVVKLEIYTE